MNNLFQSLYSGGGASMPAPLRHHKGAPVILEDEAQQIGGLMGGRFRSQTSTPNHVPMRVDSNYFPGDYVDVFA